MENQQTKTCYTCKEPLFWINKDGVGKYNGFWACNNQCQQKFPPQGQSNFKTSPDAQKGGYNQSFNKSGDIDYLKEITIKLDNIKTIVNTILDILNKEMPNE